MKFYNDKDKIGSIIILLAALIYLNATFAIPVDQVLGNEVFTARTLPIGLSVLTIFICLIQISMPVGRAADDTITDAIAGFHWKPCILLTSLMLVYSLTFNFFGFSLATFLFLFAGFTVLREKRYLLSATISAAVAIFMWVVLTQLFDIYLDSGSLYRWIGGA
jgi:putative tricarboxylic transport membrane protein